MLRQLQQRGAQAAKWLQVLGKAPSMENYQPRPVLFEQGRHRRE